MRQRMLLRRHQFFVVTLLLLFNVAACWVNYDEYLDPNEVEKWSNNLPEDRPTPGTFKSEEIAIFSKKSHDEDAKNHLYSCIKFDENHHCKVPPLKWAKTDETPGKHYIRRLYTGAGAPAFGDSRTVYPTEDQTNYYYKSEEIAIFSKKSHDEDAKNQLYSCIKFDENHHCKVPPLKWAKTGATHGKHYIRRLYSGAGAGTFENNKFVYNANGYANFFTAFLLEAEKGIKFGVTRVYAYPPAQQERINRETDQTYFLDEHFYQCDDYPKASEGFSGINTMRTAFYYKIKGYEYITFLYFFFKKNDTICIYRTHENRIVIDEVVQIKYPTKNYAPHFFTFDERLGAFVSLYWDGIRGHLPQVHFYVFKENQPEIVSFGEGYPLKDFDPDVLEEIFEEEYGENAYPAFFSCGKQVFISFTRKGATSEFSGLWKNGTEGFVYYRPLDNFQTLVRLRKDYIQKWNLSESYKPNYVADPTATAKVFVPETTTPFTTTPMPDTTTSEPSLEVPNAAANSDGKQSKESGDECGFSYYLLLFILFIVLDVLLLILLIILIIISLLGAKKIKENRKLPKTKSVEHGMEKKSKADTAPSPILKEHFQTMKNKSKAETNKKNKTADKTVTEKKTTTVDASNYYTVDATFEHSSKKKRSKK